MSAKQLIAFQLTNSGDSNSIILIRQHQPLKVICNELMHHLL